MYSEDELNNFESKNTDTTNKLNMKSNRNKSALEEKEEDFYDDFYRYEERMEDTDIEEEPIFDSENNKTSRSKLGIVVLLLLVLAVLGLLATKSFIKKDDTPKDPDPIVNIQEEVHELNENEDKKISYGFENFKDDPKANFVSSDESIATVNNDGVVHGVKEGETKVIMSYFLNEVSYQKEVIVKVNHVDVPEPEQEPPKPTPTPTPAKDTTKPTLSLALANGNGNSFVNHDVTVNVSAKDNSGKVTVQYTLNCSNNCKYQNVSGGKITINTAGTTKVTVKATDSSGNSTTNSITVKIDKEAPKCSLKVASDGTLTGSYSDNSNSFAYYGFNGDYASEKTNTKKITSAGAYTYFVKDEAGNTTTCSITVNAKTQYRSRTCDNTHKKFGSWYKRKEVYINSCGAYGKGEAERAGANWYRTRTEVDKSKCSTNTSPCYFCTAYARSIEGCNWGDEQWSPYQDTPIESTKTIQVEQALLFY